MDVIVDYSLVPIFFVALLIFILIIARPRLEVAVSQAVQSSQKSAGNGFQSAQFLQKDGQNKLTYGLLATLFALIFVWGFFLERKHRGIGENNGQNTR